GLFQGRWQAISLFRVSKFLLSPTEPDPGIRQEGVRVGASLVTAAPLRTRRLLLRDLTPRDARRIAMLASDWDVARMTGRIPHPYSEQLAYEWINDLAEGEFVQGIVHQNALIGICGYMPEGEGSAEIGYWIGKPWWGRGYATEAVGALIDYCFSVAGFERVTCGHFVDNPASA